MVKIEITNTETNYKDFLPFELTREEAERYIRNHAGDKYIYKIYG